MRYLGWSKISHPLWSKSYTPLSPLRLVAQFHICRYKFVQVHNDFDIMCMAWLTCVLMVLFLSSYSPMVPLVRFKVSAEELECFETLAELQHSERMLGWGWHQQPHHVQTTSLWTFEKQRISGLNYRRMDQVGLKRFEPCPEGWRRAAIQNTQWCCPDKYDYSKWMTMGKDAASRQNAKQVQSNLSTFLKNRNAKMDVMCILSH